MNQSHLISISNPELQGRIVRLSSEIRVALQQTSATDLKSLSLGVAKNFSVTTFRRVRNVAKWGARAISVAGVESIDAYGAARTGHFVQHVKARSTEINKGVKLRLYETGELAKSFWATARANPGEAGSQLVTLVVTSLLVSGGPDGDGGAPDLDLMFGIDAHRSFLSHSILMGAALETGILTLLQIVQIAHKNLPGNHDPVWDELLHHSNNIALSASQGASLGMAYHLLVDGLLQPAPYTDLAVPLPMEAHQTIFVVNSVGEAVDSGHKRERPGEL